MSCPAPALASLLGNIGIWIAAAELAYGAVKYLLAPLPQRREALEEFWGVAVGAAIAAAVALFGAAAPSILSQLSALFGVQAVCPQDLPSAIATWVADIALGLAEFYGFLAVLAAMSAVSIDLKIIQIRFPGAELASFMNNYAQSWVSSVQWSLLSLATLYAVALVYDLLVSKGLAALGAALLIPRRTRELGSWLVSIWLVLYFFVPLAAGFYQAQILPYVAGTCGVTEATQAALNQASQWLSSTGWGAVSQLFEAALNAAKPALPWLAGLAFSPTCLLLHILAAPLFAFHVAVANALLDMSFAAAVAVTIYVQDLIEEAPNALIPTRA